MGLVGIRLTTIESTTQLFKAKVAHGRLRFEVTIRRCGVAEAIHRLQARTFIDHHSVAH